MMASADMRGDSLGLLVLAPHGLPDETEVEGIDCATRKPVRHRCHQTRIDPAADEDAHGNIRDQHRVDGSSEPFVQHVDRRWRPELMFGYIRGLPEASCS